MNEDMNEDRITLRGDQWKDPNHKVFNMSHGELDWTLELKGDLVTLELQQGDRKITVNPFTPSESFEDYLGEVAVDDTLYFFESQIQHRKALAEAFRKARLEAQVQTALLIALLGALTYIHFNIRDIGPVIAIIAGYATMATLAITYTLYQMYKKGDWQKGIAVLRNEDEDLVEWQEALTALYSVFGNPNEEE